MKYYEVKWIHNEPKDPVFIYTEIDKDQWEHRKVEIWADGHKGFADKSREVGDTRLGTEAWPDLKQISSDPQFALKEIAKDEFESIWKEALNVDAK